MDSSKKKTVDEVFETIGGFGKYQWIVATCGAYLSMICGMHVLTNFYTTIPYDVTCGDPTLGCQDADSPSLSDFCDQIDGMMALGWERSGHAKSFVMEQDGCINSWIRPAVNSAFFIGWFIGGFSCGRLADKFGRYTLSLVLLYLGGGICMLSSLSTDPIVYILFKVAHGIAIGGLTLVSYIYTVEAAHAQNQSAVGTLVLASFSVGLALLVPLAYSIPHWGRFNRVVGLFCIPGSVWYFFMSESPRWLVANNKLEEAESVLRRIAFYNKRSYPTDTVLHVEVAGEKLGFVNIFDKCVRMRTLVMGISWMTCSFVYYGLNFASGNLGGDLYVNSLIMSVVEIPACIAQGSTVEWRTLGRKYSTIGGLFIGGLGCGFYFFLDLMELETFGRVLAFTGKMGVTASFATVYIWGAELFPTDVRSSAMGFCTSCARVGGLLGPIFAPFSFSMALFAIVAGVVGFLCYSLPETRGKSTPESLAEMSRESNNEAERSQNMEASITEMDDEDPL
eukprot:TRINITY_DN4323_c0_g1_i4.p1 TRINITY_DN4323_c0_g1~~TRINITY_DN4323_c0_g1_i4.p1  ORF type:complete len:507 (+),score=112.19 TRINITY_DN4323_c0_g1_i4:73-1593(+)